MACSSKYTLYQNNQTIKKKKKRKKEEKKEKLDCLRMIPLNIIYQKAQWAYTPNSKISSNFQLNQL